MMFINTLMMFLFCLYQIVAIFLFKQMFRYRMIVSRLNKLNLGFGFFILILTYYYRLSGPGKLCSGSQLNDEEKLIPEVADKYLLE